jgi:hypothetical protein
MNVLVFIDSQVADAHTLVAGAQAGAEVYVLHPAEDAIAQITERLRQRKNIASVHLVCHGYSGHVLLAGQRLGLEQLSGYAEQFTQWQAALKPQGQVLLYACQAAAGEQGRSFVQRLSQLIGVPVAAADGLVGNAALGGTWQLAYRTGPVDAPLPFQDAVVREYAHTLIDLADGYTFLWREAASGGISGWQMTLEQFQGTTAPSLPPLPAASGWQLAASNDFGGSGNRDLFVVNEVTGENEFWELIGDQFQQKAGSGVGSIGSNSDWKVGGSGDFDNDGKTDIFWYNQFTGETAFWKMNGFTYESSITATTPNISGFSSWKAGGVGDFDKDGKQDIFWYNEATGATTIWKMDGFTLQTAVDVGGAPNIGSFGGWQAKGAGDYNGDGNPDLFWYNPFTGETGFWRMNGTAYQQAVTTGLPLVGSPQNWQLAQTDWNFTGVLGAPGLRGEYFTGTNFEDLALVRTDATVNFNWGAASPDPSITSVDNFSVRWTGKVRPLYSEEYTFYTSTDDGVRLRVNGQTLIDAFVPQDNVEQQGKITLQAGKVYDIVMEYYEGEFNALAQLSWSSTTQAKEIIPQSQLFAPLAGGIFMGLDAPTVAENAGPATISIDRVGGGKNYTKVFYTTNNGTAEAGSDFPATQGSVTFAPGETKKTVSIPITNDTLEEPTEELGVGILDVVGAGFGTRRTTRVTILDDDATTPAFNLSTAAASVAEGAGKAVITVQRSGPATAAASVTYATSNGTATAGTDYTATSGTLSFAANETTRTFEIPITQDTATEGNETINVTLSNPTGAQLGTANSVVVTILDDDTSADFNPTPVITGLEDPTSLAFAPVSAQYGQLMFIAEKDGRVRVAKDGALLPAAFIDISDQVNEFRDRGLIGIAVHPEFFTGNPYVYLAYTYDPPETAGRPGGTGATAGPDGTGNRPSRLMKVRADVGAGYVRAATGGGSREIILGKNSTWAYTSRPDINATNDFSISPSGILNGAGTFDNGVAGDGSDGPVVVPAADIEPGTRNIRDYLATDSETHSIGDLEFRREGGRWVLYVTNGDGTSFNGQDNRATRVWDIDNLSGKMLRIDPLTGAGVAGNPFYEADDPNSNRSKIVNMGFRNPFRYTFNEAGVPVLGDVGWNTWEEVNVGFGRNFGWPFYEGGDGTSLGTSYQSLGVPADSRLPLTAAAYAYRHDGPNAIVVGDFYFGDNATYKNGLFTTDASRGSMDVLFFNAAGTDVINTLRIPGNWQGVVNIVRGPDGNMYYARLGNLTEFGGGNDGLIGRLFA